MSLLTFQENKSQTNLNDLVTEKAGGDQAWMARYLLIKCKEENKSRVVIYVVHSPLSE